MARLNELSYEEGFDVARRCSNSYTEEQYEKDFDEFVQIKKSVLRHRAKIARRRDRNKVYH